MKEPFSILPPLLRIFLRALWISYAVVAVWALLHSNLVVVVGLVAIFAVSGLIRPVPNPLGGIFDPNTGLVILAVLLWNPPEALLGVGIGSFIGLLLFRRNEMWRASNNAAGWGLPAGIASVASHTAIGFIAPQLISLIFGAVLATVVYRIVNTSIFSIYRSMRFNYPLAAHWTHSVLTQWPIHLLAAPLAVVLAAIAGRMETLLSGLGLTAAYLIVLPVARQEYAYYIRSREMLDETVEAVVRTLEGADPEARAHGDRVSRLVVATGKQFGMSERELLALRLAGRLHDVGILAETEKESTGEHHAVIGAGVLAQFPEPLIRQFVRGHHERWDGEGVPDRLRGETIPLGARILAAAETYDSARAGLSPFDAPQGPQDAAGHLTALAGTALDPKVVDTVLEVAEQVDDSRDAG